MLQNKYLISIIWFSLATLCIVFTMMVLKEPHIIPFKEPPYEQMQRSTVKVTILNDEGFVVSRGSGIHTEHGIITAGHMTRQGEQADVEYYDGTVIKNQPIKKTEFKRDRKKVPTKDLGLINTTHISKPKADLNCDVQNNIQDEVYVVGIPQGMTWTVTQGNIVSTLTRPGQQSNRWVQIDALFSRGSSGGPVFDKSGHVIGIVSNFDTINTSKYSYKSGFGFAVSSSRVCDFVGI